jgi:selenocysteine-specific elongation factor
MGLQALVEELIQAIPQRARPPPTGPFLFSVDHCFPVKGQGTVLTGTALSGRIRVGEPLELPELRLQKKVKSIQIFRRPVDACQAVTPPHLRDHPPAAALGPLVVPL